MNNGILISAAILMASLVACSNEKQTEPASVTPVENQTVSNSYAAAAPGTLSALPAFTMVDVNGNLVNLESLKGKKLFVNLWASWCPPCRREMPSIERLYQTVDTSKVAFVLLSLDDQFEKGKRYMASKKFELPLYYPAKNLPVLFSVEGIPATFIFNEQGELIKRVDGSDDYNTAMYKKLLK
jgi:thiol-disulfide isomerase/thioredoxin